MSRPKPFRTVLMASLLLCVTNDSASQERPGCVKLVLNKYCLGGQVDESLTGAPVHRDESMLAWQLDDGGESVNLLPDGRIHAVVKQIARASAHEWKRKLNSVYGPGTDLGPIAHWERAQYSVLLIYEADKKLVKILWVLENPEGL